MFESTEEGMEERIRAGYRGFWESTSIPGINADKEFDLWLRAHDERVWDEGVRAAFHESIEGLAGVHWTPSDMTNPYRSAS